MPVAVALLVFAWRGGTTVRGALASADTAIACFSGRSQHAALARLRELGAEGPRTLTTTYLHVGVPEALIGLHPLHAFELFSASSPADSHQERWTELLRAYRPRHVLHTAHRSLFESDDMYPEAIGRDGLRAAADLGIDLRVEAYPTEAGPTGWEVWTLSYPEGFDVETAAPPEELPAVGHHVCDMLTAGLVGNPNPVPAVRGVVTTLAGNGMSKEQAVGLMRASSAVYCPQFARFMGR